MPTEAEIDGYQDAEYSWEGNPLWKGMLLKVDFTAPLDGNSRICYYDTTSPVPFGAKETASRSGWAIGRYRCMRFTAFKITPVNMDAAQALFLNMQAILRVKNANRS